MRHLSILLFFAGMMIFSSSYAQYDTTWIKTYGGNREDQFLDIIRMSDFGFVTVGSTSSTEPGHSQMYIVRTDSIGELIWSKNHGGMGQEWGTSVIRTSDGGILAAGYTNSFGSGGYDAFLVKLDINGNLIYERTLGGPDWDFVWDVIEINPGEYILAGETQSYGAGGTDAWVFKYNENTDQIDWQTTIGGVEYENFKSIVQGPNGDLYAAGQGIDSGRTDEDAMITRLTTLGTVVWTKYYGDSLTDFATDLTWITAGYFAVTGGYSPTAAPGKMYANILQIFPDTGAVRNQFYWGVPAYNSFGNKVLETDQSRMCIIAQQELYAGNTDIYIAYSYPASHFFQNGSVLGGTDEENPNSGVYLNGKGFVIAGSTNGYGESFYAGLLIKVDSMTDLNNDTLFAHVPDNISITSSPTIVNEQYAIYNTALNEIWYSGDHPIEYTIYDLGGKLVYQDLIYPDQPIPVNSLPLSTGGYIFSFDENDYGPPMLIFKNR